MSIGGNPRLHLVKKKQGFTLAIVVRELTYREKIDYSWEGAEVHWLEKGSLILKVVP